MGIILPEVSETITPLTKWSDEEMVVNDIHDAIDIAKSHLNNSIKKMFVYPIYNGFVISAELPSDRKVFFEVIR